jgi:membrane protein YdbS with pleckstrin-like domain
METSKIWKSVAVSVFWIIVAMILVGYCYEGAMLLMSIPSTIFFYLGILAVASSVMILAFVCERQYRKIKIAYQKTPQQKEEQDGGVPKGEKTDDGK